MSSALEFVQNQLDEKRKEIARLKADNEKLRGFAQDVWDHGLLTSANTFNLAEKHGLCNSEWVPTKLLTGEPG